MMINTLYGDFNIIRKDAVAMSVIRMRHDVRHHRKIWKEGDISHVEHRRIPTNVQDVKLNLAAWATHIATFDLKGNMIKLECCKNI